MATGSEYCEYEILGVVEKFTYSQFDRELGNDMVLLRVGQEGTSEFLVHQKLLFEKAPRFVDLYRESKIEDGKGKVVILDDTVAIFVVFMEWLYLGTIMSLSFGSTNFTDKNRELLLTLYFLAIKYFAIELADRSLSGYIVTFTIAKELLTPRSVRELYERTVPGSKLRKVAVQFAAYGLRTCPDLGGGRSLFYGMAFYQNADLMMDVLGEIRPRYDGKIMDPRKAHKCDFHDHPTTDVCPYGPLETRAGIYEV